MTTILLVDDSEEYRAPVAAALKRRGFSVVAAEDGEQALKHVADNKPDLLILDMVMPRLDGMSVLRALRTRPATSSLPVILLTGKDDEENLIEARELGAMCLLKYCVTLDELCARVHRRLAGERMHAAI